MAPIRIGADLRICERRRRQLRRPKHPASRTIPRCPGRHGAHGLPDQEDPSRPTLWSALAAPACALSTLLQIRARSIVSSATARASAARRRTPSNSELRRAPLPALSTDHRTGSHACSIGIRPVEVCVAPQADRGPQTRPPCPSFCRFPSAFPNRNAYKLFRLLNGGDLQV